MNRYHTSLKVCYSLGLEKQFIPKEIRSTIPNSTSSYWKKTLKSANYIGDNLAKTVHKQLEDIQNAHHPINAIPLKLFNAYTSFTIKLFNCLDPQVLKKEFRKNKEQIINLIDQYTDHFSFKEVSKLLGVSVKSLYHWRTQTKFKCDHSALLVCAKRHVNQATIQEVNVVKNWLSKPEYLHWGIHSIWGLAFKNHSTTLSKQSWSNYSKLLQLRKNSQKAKKPKYKPLKAERINQIWHADITVFKTADQVKYYIYTVMDNYSRHIHSWRIERMVSSEFRLANIKDAIKTAFDGKDHSLVQLVTDGGPENANLTLKRFMTENSSTIHHTIALRDIIQSNSMMEAFYRITKYSFLYTLKIENYEQLIKYFEEWINTYNNEKPHYALGLLTPNEVLLGIDLGIQQSEILKKAALDRRTINRIVNCLQKC